MQPLSTQGALQMHLPASAFTNCCEAEYPSNTLFADVNPLSIGFGDMEKYLPLLLAMFDTSPLGIFAAIILQSTVNVINALCNHETL